MITNLVSRFAASCSDPTFFGLKPWYAYLHRNPGDCQIIFNPLPENGRSDILLIMLALIDDLLTLAGLLAIGYIIFAGIQYMVSQGSPEATQKAQSNLQNSLIGLVICVLAIALVRFIGASIG